MGSAAASRTIKRRYIVTIEIQAGTWDEMANALDDIARDFQIEQPAMSVYTESMGNGAVYNYLIRENKEGENESR